MNDELQSKHLKLIISLTVGTAVIWSLVAVYFLASSHELSPAITTQLNALPQNIDLKFLQGIVHSTNTL